MVVATTTTINIVEHSSMGEFASTHEPDSLDLMYNHLEVY